MDSVKIPSLLLQSVMSLFTGFVRWATYTVVTITFHHYHVCIFIRDLIVKNIFYRIKMISTKLLNRASCLFLFVCFLFVCFVLFCFFLGVFGVFACLLFFGGCNFSFVCDLTPKNGTLETVNYFYNYR